LYWFYHAQASFETETFMERILDIVLVFFVAKPLLLVPFFHRFGHALPEAPPPKNPGHHQL